MSWTWDEWAAKIDKNFEDLFYIHHVPKPEYEPVPELINIRGMYKDSHVASQFWADYQLRCNFPIAMVVVSQSSPANFNRARQFWSQKNTPNKSSPSIR